jgi:hypothetical protein
VVSGRSVMIMYLFLSFTCAGTMSCRRVFFQLYKSAGVSPKDVVEVET